MIFFFDRAFYQGRTDKLSGYFERATIAALDTVLVGSSSDERLSSLNKLSHWLNREQWRTKGNPLWEALGRKYGIGRKKEYRTGRERDKEMVLDSLRFVVGERVPEDMGKENLDDWQMHHLRELKVWIYHKRVKARKERRRRRSRSN